MPKYTQDGIEAALAALGIEGMVGDNGWMMVCCPLHGDHSPSMAINSRTGGWKCFSGCGTGGILELATRMGQGLNLEVLSALENPDPLRTERTDDDVAKMLAALEERDPPSEAALLSFLGYCEYLRERGITNEASKFFGLAYDPERRNLIIPIRDHRGKLMGAESRTVDKSVHSRRYKAIWKCSKSDWVWGACKYHPLAPLLVFEGALGAARARSLGSKTAVATLGATASEGQLARLSQSSFVGLAYDPDDAGRRGSKKVSDELIVTDHAVVELPRDIDDISASQLYNAVVKAAPRHVDQLMVKLT